jgi:gluconolactonase
VRIEVVAEGLQFPEGPVVCEDGSAFVAEVAAGRVSRVTPEGKVHVVAETGGSPNGLAVGPDQALYCCNSGGFDMETRDTAAMHAAPPADYVGGWVERIEIATGKVDRLYSEHADRTLGGPNDVAFAADGSFWFTDFGKWTHDGMRHGGLYHAAIDGSHLRRAAFGLSLNGVAVASDGSAIFASATHERWLLRFDPEPARCNQLGEVLSSLPGRQFLDSMALEEGGRLAVGCIGEEPGIARIDPVSGAMSKVPMPDMLPTNIAFGGSDMRTAFITLSERGLLVKCSWPSAGAKLPYNI